MLSKDFERQKGHIVLAVSPLTDCYVSTASSENQNSINLIMLLKQILTTNFNWKNVAEGLGQENFLSLIKKDNEISFRFCGSTHENSAATSAAYPEVKINVKKSFRF